MTNARTTIGDARRSRTAAHTHRASSRFLVHVAIAALLIAPSAFSASGFRAYTPDTPALVGTVANYLGVSDVHYDAAYFQSLRDAGVQLAYALVPWSLVEPANGTFDWSAMDAFAAGARNAGLSYGWYFINGKVWGGSPLLSPPAWVLGEPEVDANGTLAGYPAWWNASAQSAYVRFLTTALARYDPDPSFLAYYPAYGWLDASWGPGGSGQGHGFFGYAPSDRVKFQAYVAEEYGTIKALDRAWRAHYRSFAEVQLPLPGQGGFQDLQRFRQWSVIATYDSILNATMPLTRATPILPLPLGGRDLYEAHSGQRADLLFALATRRGGIVASTAGLGEFAPTSGATAIAIARLAEERHVTWVGETGTLPPTATTIARDLGAALAGGAMLRGLAWTFEYPPTAPPTDPSSWGAMSYRSELPIWTTFHTAAPGAIALPGALAAPRLALWFPGDDLDALAPDAADDQVGLVSWTLQQLEQAGVAFTVVTDRDLASGAASFPAGAVILDVLEGKRGTSDVAGAIQAAGWSARASPAGAGLEVFARATPTRLLVSAASTGSPPATASTLQVNLSSFGLAWSGASATVVNGDAWTIDRTRIANGTLSIDVRIPSVGEALVAVTPTP